MAAQDEGWLAEIERRAEVYDKLGDGGDGRLGRADYIGMAALATVLLVVFWVWAV